MTMTSGERVHNTMLFHPNIGIGDVRVNDQAAYYGVG